MQNPLLINIFPQLTYKDKKNSKQAGKKTLYSALNLVHIQPKLPHFYNYIQ